ncbi:UbiH/UbiF family hydroxylase [Uliginosibacterium sp. H3]|uniref:UbiH/UbiF family hydroxylase n=1 Tax=Uliginosibacterium silvisoli TaxID=3114758 RepID=A0ABU6K333_9RHOO|nr:UbiH/UbiF family hydroxylase [Uliginosibacterium sp. H3]
MKNEDFDVLIVGGGLAGASLACALRGSRYRVALLDRTAPRLGEGWDTRVYAIAPACIDFLRRCGAWDHLPPERVQRIERMAIAGDAGGALTFSAYESGLDALAWIVEGSRLAVELWQTASRQSNITVVSPAMPAALSIDADAARLTLADGRVLSAKLVIGADGANSWVREQAGIAAQSDPYPDKAVVANFACERPHDGTAFQWFREDGVLAWLPLPGNNFSIVWSTPSQHADALLALDAQSLAERVAAAGSHELGALQLLAPAAAFPLRLMRVKETVMSRLALIGDAAHAIHPLSGHGINLGFQDAAALADVLLALPSFRDCGDAAVLKKYRRARAEEVALLQGVTHGLHELFAVQAAPLAWLRNAGMSMTGKMPFVRGVMTRYAAGLI